MKKSFGLSLILIVVCMVASLLYAADKLTPEIEKYLQSRPELRGKVPTTKSPAEVKKAPKTPEEMMTTPAFVPEREPSPLTILESLIREKGILPPEELKVFGQQLFASGPTSYTPPTNMPVTTDYIIGPDDTIVINTWGRLNETYTLMVQRNGSIFIPQVGSIHVAGLSYKQLVTVLRKQVESVLGVSSSVTMGELRSIAVFVVGAVKQPGAYTVSAFDTILNALIYAGGPETKSMIEDWYREKLKEENLDVRQLVERLKEEKEKAFPREKTPESIIRSGEKPNTSDGQLRARSYSLGANAAPSISSQRGVMEEGSSELPRSARKKDEYSTLMELLAILKDERQSEDVIKRVRELNADELQKELESLENAEKKRDKYTSLRQFIEKMKTDKEWEAQKKDYEKLDIRQLEEELRKLNAADPGRQERDYTLKQHTFSEEQYKKAQKEKEVLLTVQFGSMRNIQLKRNDKIVSTFDLYDLILQGDKSKDLRLQQGDVIFVPKPASTVAIYGDVKVPAIYELKQDQSLQKALELAGGLKTSAYGGQIQVQRYANNQERVVLDASLESLKGRKDPFLLQDGDRVRVFPIVDEDVNAIYLYGNVKRSGKYQFRPGLRISEVLNESDLQLETDFSYAFVKRYERPAMMPTIISFKLGEAILQKISTEDLTLQPYDEIYIFRRWDLQSRPDITLSGEVRNPGKYPYQKDMRVKDALFMAGGPTVGASMNSAHIFRTNPQTGEVTMLVVDIARSLVERDDSNILLQDKDRLVIHHIQEYRPEKYVTIEGEVLRPGQYPLAVGMTIRELVFAAGNVKEGAYLDDAELTSMTTVNERGTVYEQRNLNLRGAIAGDRSQNLSLQAYDRLFVKGIPDWRQERFVTVRGEIRFPGRYLIRKGERLASIVERAGGYKETAYLRAVYFTRERVRDLQQKGLKDMAERMERELLTDTSITTATSSEEVSAKKVELEQKQKFVESVRLLKASGRMTIHLADLRQFKGSEYDIELEDGDNLFIPQKNSVINVVGAVMSQGSYVYSEKMTYQNYIESTGGFSSNADTDNIFVMKVDGSARKLSRGFFNWNPFRGGFFNWNNSRDRWELSSTGGGVREIEPGDTIVVPDKIERIAWLRQIRDITQIMMNAAVTAGVVLQLY